VQVLVLEVSRNLGYGGAQKGGCVRVPYGSEHTTGRTRADGQTAVG